MSVEQKHVRECLNEYQNNATSRGFTLRHAGTGVGKMCIIIEQ